MKNFVENQCIKTDKPLPMSYEALKAERDVTEELPPGEFATWPIGSAREVERG